MSAEAKSPALRLRCQRALTPAGVMRGAVITIVDGVISTIQSAGEVVATGGGPDDDPDAETAPVDLPGWVLPGFVDTHVHAGGGADFSTTNLAEARRVVAFHRSHGTTSMLASLVTAELEVLCDQLETLGQLVEEGELAGIHLEGPFLSAARCGAHDPRLLRSPAPEVIDRLLAAGQGHISMITMAPELPGAGPAIERLVAEGVRVAIGHTDADEAATSAALDAGASVVTHLFNAMRPIHHRQPGPVPLLLTDPRVLVELICDGTHLHRDVLAMAIAAAGPGRVALITDAMAATGMADGSYRIGGLAVTVQHGVARLATPDGSQGSIAGSTLTMAAAFGYVVREVGCSIPQASRMASATPAGWHGIECAGRIEVGARADLVVTDDQGELRRVLSGGSWVADR